ncbi:MAG: hypothetical protein RBT11_14925 [Desulfobacterales bacterium]|jgi:hypothetical protein|nr:hypothetical protein [Desulfobacterales bacterium]
MMTKTMGILSFLIIWIGVTSAGYADIQSSIDIITKMKAANETALEMAQKIEIEIQANGKTVSKLLAGKAQKIKTPANRRHRAGWQDRRKGPDSRFRLSAAVVKKFFTTDFSSNSFSFSMLAIADQHFIWRCQKVWPVGSG